VRITVHVRPGSSRTSVGGDYDGALVVRVQPRAVDGAATAAVEAALADAFAVPQRCVTCVAGHSARRKQIDIEGDAAELQRRLEELRSETLLP